MKRVIIENGRLMTWKYWVFLGVWECAALAIATASVVGGSATLTLSSLLWTFFFLTVPALPLLIPMSTQIVIGHVVNVVLTGLFFLIMLLAAGGYVAVWIAPESARAYKWRYLFEDDFDSSTTLSVDRKPHDCEFMSAPLGSKHCHYEKRVKTVRVRRGKSGTRLASYDEGRTWSVAEAGTRPAVFVTWERVSD